MADDEVLIGMVIADALVDAGYRVIEASNAEEALALLEVRDDVRLLVTDVKMPGKLDGFALARLVGSCRQLMGIIITSGHALSGDEEAPESTLFLPKPFKAPALLRHVEQITSAARDATIAPIDVAHGR